MLAQTSIVIVTRNRKNELERALRSCLSQLGEIEILVIDDASSDGTSEMVAQKFPMVNLTVSDKPRGYIVQRNRAALLAKGEFIISIDDDAEFSDPSIVENCLTDFEISPCIAAVAIPYTEPPDYQLIFQRAKDRSHCWITSKFVGTAYAIRRKDFLSLGGFDESLVHQGEERDFCLRMLSAGLFTRLGTSAAILHHRSDKRNFDRMTYFGRRNDICFVWQHVPFPQVCSRLVGTTAMGLFHGVRYRRFLSTFAGIVAGFKQIISGLERKPANREVYQKFRRINSGVFRIDTEPQ